MIRSRLRRMWRALAGTPEAEAPPLPSPAAASIPVEPAVTRKPGPRPPPALATAQAPYDAVAVVHAWYPDAFSEICMALEASGVRFRVVATTVADREGMIRDAAHAAGMEVEVVTAENKGRDVLPFLEVADRLASEGEDVVLKLHTKRSPHRADGDDWRRDIVDRLVSPDRASWILDAFSRQSDLGMVGPEGHVLPMNGYWGGNQDNVSQLCSRMGFALPDGDVDQFVGGSMFWVRLAALRPLMEMRPERSEFETEDGQLDATMAHAIERLFAHGVRASGHRVAHAAAVCGEPEPEPGLSRRYYKPKFKPKPDATASA